MMKKGNYEVKAFKRRLVIQIRLMGSRQTKERHNEVASIAMAYKTENEYMISVVLLRNGCYVLSLFSFWFFATL